MRALLLVALLALFAQLADAQAPDSTRRAPGTTVSGIVHDSVARRPLAGATVQVVRTDPGPLFVRTATSDSLGRFVLTDVPDGRYALGFLHPMVDSLGIELPLREVHVSGGRPVRSDLAIPSPDRLHVAICGPASSADSGALVLGIVRDGHAQLPVGGATVAGEWLEFSLGPGGLFRRVPRITATTAHNGWFALCNVPRGGTMELTASRGGDSTGVLEMEIPATGFLRRDLYLGSTSHVAGGDTATRPDTGQLAPRRVNTGDGRLSGIVVRAADGRPLAGAQVTIIDGPQARSNELGEWTIANAAIGTRMIEVRAVGYFPERRPVDVVPGAPPVGVALSTLKAVLDTVMVTAKRIYDPRRSAFEDRRRGGMGRFLTAEDLARRNLIFTSDVFRTVPGVRLAADPDGFGRRIWMRGNFQQGCSPVIYLDGHYVGELTADDVDAYVSPKNIMGIEIYVGGMMPAQFQQGFNRCGAIVIWTK